MPVDDGERKRTPLFSPDGRSAFTGSALDSILQRILRTLMPAAEASKYSWHSARIYLACALLAAGASPGQIQALCRWVSEESLHIYARLNESAYAYWVTRAMSAPVESSRTTNLVAGLPQTDDDEALRLLSSLNLAEAGGEA